MVTVSESAAGKIKELLGREGRPDYGLRMKVVGGGCSGLQYEMDFEPAFAKIQSRLDAGDSAADDRDGPDFF